MNRFALLVGLLAGGVGLASMYTYMVRFENEALGGTPETVLVATQDIPLGTRLDEAQLGRKQVPQRYLEERHVRVSDLQKVLGVRVASSVKSGEALLWTDLSSSTVGSRRVTDYLQDGMRALTVRGDSTTLIRPGDRVDIFHTAQASSGLQTTMLLQNVVVIGVGGAVGPELPGRLGGMSRGGSGITVGVQPRQGSFLTLAEQTGRLTFAVRPSSDVVIIQDPPPVRPADLRNEEQIRTIVRSARRPTGMSSPQRF